MRGDEDEVDSRGLYTAAHINTRRSMTIHKLWQPRVKRRGSSYDFPFVSLKICRWQLRRIWLTERAAKIVGFFYEGPAVRVSLAVIYMARERQGSPFTAELGPGPRLQTLLSSIALHFYNAPGMRERACTALKFYIRGVLRSSVWTPCFTWTWDLRPVHVTAFVSIVIQYRSSV